MSVGISVHVVRENDAYEWRSQHPVASPFSVQLDLEPSNTLSDIRHYINLLMPGVLTRTSQLRFNQKRLLEFTPKATQLELYLDYCTIGRPILVDFNRPKHTLKDLGVIHESALHITEPLLCKS